MRSGAIEIENITYSSYGRDFDYHFHAERECGRKVCCTLSGNRILIGRPIVPIDALVGNAVNRHVVVESRRIYTRNREIVRHTPGFGRAVS